MTASSRPSFGGPSDALGCLAAEASRYIAGGVVSLNRKVSPALTFVSGAGSRLRDQEGREYIDYHAAFSPHLLGHNHPEVNQAVKASIDRGDSLFGSGTTAWEVRLARLLCETISSLEQVQIANTGSEGTAHAIRLSRAHTGRDDVILPLGGYNGWHNDVARAVMPTLEQVGPRVSPGQYPFVPGSAGIPADHARHLHVVNFNDLDSIEYVMRRFPTACVLLEPVLQNIGVVPPEPGYLAGVRALCDRYGTVLVFDEVKTGFRAALGGYQELCGVRPDLSVFGKAVASGYPMGVIGGRRKIMQLFCHDDPRRRVLIAGTYNAHPFSTAAAIATIEILRDRRRDIYPRLERLGARIEGGLTGAFRRAGVSAVVSRVGSAFCFYFMDHVPRDWHDILAHHDFDLDRRFRRGMIEQGIYVFPVACKQSSISAAHSEADVDRAIQAAEKVIQGLTAEESGPA